MADQEWNYTKSSSLTIGQAKQGAPSLRSAWEVCNAGGFLTYLDQTALVILEAADSAKLEQQNAMRTRGFDPLRDVNGTDRAQAYAAALEKILEDYPGSLKTLPNGTLAEITDRISRARDISPELLHQIYRNYSIADSPAFEVWALPRKIELFRRLENDPVMREAKTGFPDMTPQQRLDFARHIHGIQVEVFGFQPASTIGTYESSYPGWLSYENGGYITDDNSMVFNVKNPSILWGLVDTFDTSFNSDDLSEFIATILHEGDHRFQDELAERYGDILLQEYLREGETQDDAAAHPLGREILPGGSLREVAYMLYMNHRNYLQESTEMYRSNPVEQHSWAMNEFAEGLMGEDPGAYRQALEMRLAEVEKGMKFAEIRNRSSEVSINQPEKPCADVTRLTL